MSAPEIIAQNTHTDKSGKTTIVVTERLTITDKMTSG